MPQDGASPFRLSQDGAPPSDFQDRLSPLRLSQDGASPSEPHTGAQDWRDPSSEPQAGRWSFLCVTCRPGRDALSLPRLPSCRVGHGAGQGHGGLTWLCRASLEELRCGRAPHPVGRDGPRPLKSAGQILHTGARREGSQDVPGILDLTGPNPGTSTPGRSRVHPKLHQGQTMLCWVLPASTRRKNCPSPADRPHPCHSPACCLTWQDALPWWSPDPCPPCSFPTNPLDPTCGATDHWPANHPPGRRCGPALVMPTSLPLRGLTHLPPPVPAGTRPLQTLGASFLAPPGCPGPSPAFQRLT